VTFLPALLLAACTEEPEAPEPGLTPEERLDALAPGLAVETAKHTKDLGAVADVLELASPSLRRFLIARDSGKLDDALDELVEGPDIAWVKVFRTPEGSCGAFTGHVDGASLDTLQLYANVRGGPAPDVRLDLGTPVMLSTVIPGSTQVEDNVAISGQAFHDDHGWDFTIDVPGVTGSPAARSCSPVQLTARAGAPEDADHPLAERDRVDDAAAGSFGVGNHVPELVVELLDDGAKDPDLLVAIAATWGPWLDLVEPSVRPTVHAAARERLRYASEVDRWLAEQGRPWSVHALGATQKLTWAWPGGEGAVYGARPLAWETGLLSAEAWRFHVADVETLRILRDELPLGDDPVSTAEARDARTWADMAYRADDEGMRALCDQERLDRRDCFLWEHDVKAGASLGTVDGAPVPLAAGTSATLQTDRWVEEGSFVGDCSTATTVMIAALQAVGLAPIALGWAGETWYDPTHNLPLVWDGRVYRATQAGPSAKWAGRTTFVYGAIPFFNSAALGIGWGGYGATGSAVPGAVTTYGELNTLLDDGVAADTVLRWMADGREGAWPEIR